MDPIKINVNARGWPNHRGVLDITVPGRKPEHKEFKDIESMVRYVTNYLVQHAPPIPCELEVGRGLNSRNPELGVALQNVRGLYNRYQVLLAEDLDRRG